ncbi:hypothetical protein BU16DRAFT_52220 [Lophium mytilinum]|uniref:F-box domain-containing protein n=1 Tax=Lophium mytilinum TaxID=390894 RepID=A0A6A6QNK0_9PEZI|nr:hypothetical protein BU16DRAFT_52220 [Lophium mytilinum]
MLLTLPRELRDLIYTFALCPPDRDHRVKIHRSPAPIELSHLRVSIDLSLLRVSRQLYTETHPLYYSTNLFHVLGRAADTLIPFVDNIGPRGLQHLRALSVAPSGETASRRVRFSSAIAQIPQLERLELRLFDTYFLSEAGRGNSVAETLDRSHDYGWLTPLSGLKRFDIVLGLQCGRGEQGCGRPNGRSCVEWREAAREVQRAIRVEVCQPRAAFGMSPSYSRRQRQRAKAMEQRKFLREMEKFRERMERELERPEMGAVRRELRARFASASQP